VGKATRTFGCGLEALEGRQLLSATYAGGHAMVTHVMAPPAASVHPLAHSPRRAVAAVGSARPRALLRVDDPFVGDYGGSLFIDSMHQRIVKLSIQTTDGQGNYFGTFGIADVNGQTTGPTVTRRVQFRINAAGDFLMLSVGPKLVVSIKGVVTDGTVQGAYRSWERGGAFQSSLYASTFFGVG
jgi:hypothetical protein